MESISPEHGVQTKTHYRRSWTGQAVKHGVEMMGNKWDGAWERWYDDGDLRIERHWAKGKVHTESYYRNGKRHGPHFDTSGDGSNQTHGEYRDGQKHGEWKFADGDLLVSESWRDDRPHGRMTWETAAGRQLQSAEYERGRLTKWNDLPIAEALEGWVNENVTDADLRRLLLTSLPNSPGMQIISRPYEEIEVLWRIPPNQQLQRLIIHLDRSYFDDDIDRSGRLLGEALLAESLQNWHTFAFRFNQLSLVPIKVNSLDWRDRTGVYAVQFEPGSPQEMFWLQQIVADPLFAEFPATRFRQILNSRDMSPIEIDVSAMEDLVKPPLKTSPTRLLSWMARARRDLLGQHLDREGCYVEQEGNKLIIRRHSDRE